MLQFQISFPNIETCKYFCYQVTQKGQHINKTSIPLLSKTVQLVFITRKYTFIQWLWTHLLLNNVCVCVNRSLCLTLCDPMDCTSPGFSVHAILQARILEWVAMPSSRARTHISYISCIGRWVLYTRIIHGTWQALNKYQFFVFFF